MRVRIDTAGCLLRFRAASTWSIAYLPTLILARVELSSAHDQRCPARIGGTYELDALHRPNNRRYLHGHECRLSGPEVMFGVFHRAVVQALPVTKETSRNRGSNPAQVGGRPTYQARTLALPSCCLPVLYELSTLLASLQSVSYTGCRGYFHKTVHCYLRRSSVSCRMHMCEAA